MIRKSCVRLVLPYTTSKTQSFGDLYKSIQYYNCKVTLLRKEKGEKEKMLLL